MLKLYESTCRIYPSISPFPYKLFSKVRKHLLLTSRIVQPADTQGQHITLQYPKTLSYRGFFSVRRDNNCKTQSRTIAEKPTQSPPLTPGCWTLSRFFMSQVDVSCSIFTFVFPTSRTTLEKSTSERSWVDEGRVVGGLLSQSFIMCSTVWASPRICKQSRLTINDLLKIERAALFSGLTKPLGWCGE